MKNKIKIAKCMGCFFEYVQHKEQRISRQSKKMLKKFLGITFCINTHFWVDSCTMRRGIRNVKPMYKYIGFLKKYNRAITVILAFASESSEPVFVDLTDRGIKFNWSWENDNGLYTDNGYDPFEYYRDDTKEETWFYEETKELLERFGLNIYNIKSDKEFILAVHQLINKKPLPLFLEEFLKEKQADWFYKYYYFQKNPFFQLPVKKVINEKYLQTKNTTNKK